MNVLGIRVGIQSWCFRGLDGLSAIVDALKACNIDALEITSIHANYDNAEEVRAYFESHGIILTCGGVYKFTNDPEVMDKLFQMCKKLGLTTIGIDPDRDSIELLNYLCNKYDIKAGIHNHGKKHRYGRMDQLDAILAYCSDKVGILLDTAWALDAGENPLDWIDRYQERILGIHFKDFTFDKDGNHEEAILGEGDLDLDGLINKLRKMNYLGVLSLEYEGEVNNPVPNTKRCVDRLCTYVL